NGEIYNYPELRAELEAQGAAFRSDCDIEAAIHGYRAWGVRSFARYNGMFAFALWDAPNRRLFLVRDRLGRAVPGPEEAGALAGVAGGAGGVDEREDGVGVAVVAELAHPLDVARGLPLAPELVTGAAPEVELAGRDRPLEGLGVDPGEGEDLAARCVLDHARREAALVECDLVDHGRQSRRDALPLRRRLGPAAAARSRPAQYRGSSLASGVRYACVSPPSTRNVEEVT
ncbi:MAG: hypothetical protein EDQ89_01690, partial [Acidobacteria bacterium]